MPWSCTELWKGGYKFLHGHVFCPGHLSYARPDTSGHLSFPNFAAAGLAVDVTATEDPEAGIAGAPFTEPEHEEEWVEWVDCWAGITTEGAGGSSSAAGPSSA